MSESNSSPPQEEAMHAPSLLPENWAKMSGEEKSDYFIGVWSETEGNPFLSQPAKEKYARRAKRWLDIISNDGLPPDKTRKYSFLYRGCEKTRHVLNGEME